MNMIKKTHILPMKNVTVCTFKTSPFVPAPRAHMFQHVCAWCRYTRRRFERTHGDVLSGHTAPHTTSHTQTHQNTTRRQRRRQRQRQRQRQREKRRRRGETRQEKRRQKKTRQEKREDSFCCVVVHGLFFVGVVIFWLIQFAHET